MEDGAQSRCKVCGNLIKFFEVINYDDLEGWCSFRCFKEDIRSIRKRLFQKKTSIRSDSYVRREQM